jgi:hypothetical protein
MSKRLQLESTTCSIGTTDTALRELLHGLEARLVTGRARFHVFGDVQFNVNPSTVQRLKHPFDAMAAPA